MQEVNLAFDFGASSGRLVMGEFDGEKITLEEIHRFPNEPVWFNGRLYWDFFRLFHEMKVGLSKAAKMGVKIASIGIDTWGVDFAFLDKDGHLLGNTIHYRDDRGKGMLQEMERDKGVSLAEIYKATGNQYMTINSLFQLYYDVNHRPHIVENAESLLFMPDLFSYGLTGEKHNEYTIASTSQMLDAEKRDWAWELLQKLDLPTRLLQPIIQPGEVWGELTKEVQEEVGLPKVPVIAVGSHDTASAVAGTPLNSSNCAYLSCGSWSLLGMELTTPLINDESYECNFTNEGGVEGTIRYLKNITGLWIIQQLKRKWAQSDAKVDYAYISSAAKQAEHIDYMIDPNHESFVAPFDMEQAVVEYCEATHGKKPQTLGETARAAYNGIVNEYNRAVQALEKTLKKPVECINMVGGGTQDEFLCQLTADVTGKEVQAGPIEASVTGNILMQLKALNRIKSIAEGRQVVQQSFAMKHYSPRG